MHCVDSLLFTTILVTSVFFTRIVAPARLPLRETSEPYCWLGDSTAHEETIPTVFKACDDAIGSMLTNAQSSQKPIQFGRKPGLGYKVPAQWRRGNCQVKIDVHGEDDIEIASFIDIARQAILVNLFCVAPRPHYGGTKLVGRNQVMNVSLSGLPQPQSKLQLGKPSAVNPQLDD
ncbi:MAG: hypothetical protein Q9182_000790 [Xanthomendoza sp. 2 TL-2023]